MTGTTDRMPGFELLPGPRSRPWRMSTEAPMGDRAKRIDFGELLGGQSEADEKPREPDFATAFPAGGLAPALPPPVRVTASLPEMLEAGGPASHAKPATVDMEDLREDANGEEPTATLVSVLRQETHLGPAGLMPLRGMFSGEAASWTGVPAAPRSPAGPELRDAPAPAGGPLRVLRVMIEPEGAAPVDATLRLREGALDIRISTAGAAEARLLEAAAPDLGDRLRNSGYAVERLTIDRAGPCPATRRDECNSSGQVANATSGREHVPVSQAVAGRPLPAGPESQPKDRNDERRRTTGRDRRGARP